MGTHVELNQKYPSCVSPCLLDLGCRTVTSGEDPAKSRAPRGGSEKKKNGVETCCIQLWKIRRTGNRLS